MNPPESFGALTSALDYPMFIVTVAPDGGRAGCLVGFATQCSIDPVRFLVCGHAEALKAGLSASA